MVVSMLIQEPENDYDMYIHVIFMSLIKYRHCHGCIVLMFVLYCHNTIPMWFVISKKRPRWKKNKNVEKHFQKIQKFSPKTLIEMIKEMES